MGVVKGDSNPVEAYLISGGDPTWKLNHPEAQLLARSGPGVYDVDHQLCGLQTCGQHPTSDRPQRETVEGWGQRLLLVRGCHLHPATGDLGLVPQC